jgi:ssDNA-binding replication factor A large subunit
MCSHSELTIRRDNQIGRVPFSLLCDERGTVRVDFDDAAVEVQYDAESGGTLE